MPLSPDHRRSLLEASKASAAALLEDHLRELIAKPDQSRGEIRRTSAILRRLLVEGDLTAIAAPRIGKITLSAPDNKPVYKTVSPQTVAYFISGGAHIFGVALRAAMSSNGVRFHDFDPDRIVSLRVDTFLTQNVLFYKGKWINRAAIIKYVANIAHGVHAGAPQTDDEKLLSEARRALVISRHENDGIGISFTSVGKIADEPDLNFSPSGIDLLLIETFAAARYLVESPSVIALEAAIRDGI